MKEHKNNLDKAIDAIKNESIPSGPPQEAVDATLAKLAEAANQSGTATAKKQLNITEKAETMKSFAKMAAAAVLLIGLGYAIGRLSAPTAPDMQQLHHTLETSLKSSLEPAIRRDLLEQLNRRCGHFCKIFLFL